ncbi:hypothetical protein [Victivallis sp. Marseille-Q1083]|uniref:hypothetical protein n=1 Tax=Victivallis sp. Marseille-Q1083 TaxID=2717288 RepID=UPI00158D9590|nr:hypothetical protein [Victivallis sp. Marseille-Q1083]
MNLSAKKIWGSGLVLLLAAAGIAAWWWQARQIFDWQEMVLEKEHHGQTVFLQRGSFTMRVNLPLNRDTTVSYVIPVDREGKPLPSASNLIFYAPFNGDWGHLFFENAKWLENLWLEQGYSVFSLLARTNLKVTDDVTRYYIYPECGWYEVIWRIQDELVRKYGLEKRPLLVVGESAGGSLGQQMAVTEPDRVDAAAWCGGTRYRLEAGPGRGALLALSTWGCPGSEASDAMGTALRQQGRQVLRALTPPDLGPGVISHHSTGRRAYELICSFIRGVVALRDANGGVLPAVAHWPVRRQIDGQTCWLPSEEFAAQWDGLPREVTDAVCGGKTPEAGWVAYPASPEADRLALLVFSAEFPDPAVFMDGLAELAARKVVPVVVAADEEKLTAENFLPEMLEKILQEERWRDLPLIVIGMDLTGQRTAIAALNNGSDRIRRIVLLDTDYESPFPQWSIQAFRAQSDIPLLMLCSTSALPEQPDPCTAWEYLEPEKNAGFGQLWRQAVRRAVAE